MSLTYVITGEMMAETREWEDLSARLGLEGSMMGADHGGRMHGSSRLPIISPLDGRVLAEVVLADADDYDRIMESALVEQTRWFDISAPERGEAVRRIADAVEARKDDLGLLITYEVGKTLSEGRGEVQEMIDMGRFATGLSRQLYGLTMPSERAGHRLSEMWHPIGPVGVITSFNFPCAVWSWNAFIAAVVGDVTLWKPSDKAPLTAIAVMNLVDEVMDSMGMPKAFHLVCGPGSVVGDAMSVDPRLPLVSFTGSVATGARVSVRVAGRLGRSLLELGGNNAAIVTPSADMTMAVEGVAFGALATAGQRCTSTRRLILQRDIYDDFLERLKGVYRQVGIGDPREPTTLMGPLINQGAVMSFLRAVEAARSQGGRLIYGGTRHVEDGNYVVPAIIEAEPDMPMVSEETFAPILYVMRYDTIEEAIYMNNMAPQGLSSAIFSTDLREAELFQSHRGSDCGMVNINTSTAGAEIGGAFGGEKETGGGRESGSDAWKAYAVRRTVTVNRSRELELAQGVTFRGP